MADSWNVSWTTGATRAGLFALLWLVLAGPDPVGLAFGAVAVLGATALSLRLLRPAPSRAPWRALGLLPGFVWRSLLGGIDVARRALDPRLPLAPAWNAVPCRLPAGGRFIIGAEFSLMPGTLVAGCRDGCYLVHLLDERQPVVEAMADEEARLGRALGHADRPGDRAPAAPRSP
ncbi:Na+/H+ antiporter subunit E [Wenzhouxiangella sp. XN79A]|uniref:Na+/H+ antiporter subunit E n=1 Tax=Wenzhouxiangella sp. XN79A TaxID=2724193 RepID=UPI00144A7692|nr:Na+/H+ antiporter subunit E [Wenzhouxiangella sp. XN79A]NKI35615.1 Na+/H+ antiporter subunit E [Wenzhouxiangella sp. XN79A]